MTNIVQIKHLGQKTGLQGTVIQMVLSIKLCLLGVWKIVAHLHMNLMPQCSKKT